ELQEFADVFASAAARADYGDVDSVARGDVAGTAQDVARHDREHAGRRGAGPEELTAGDSFGWFHWRGLRRGWTTARHRMNPGSAARQFPSGVFTRNSRRAN